MAIKQTGNNLQYIQELQTDNLEKLEIYGTHLLQVFLTAFHPINTSLGRCIVEIQRKYSVESEVVGKRGFKENCKQLNQGTNNWPLLRMLFLNRHTCEDKFSTHLTLNI